MSFNVHATVEDETGTVMKVILPRASRGITSTAVLGIGDTISFGGVQAKVTNIVHEHVSLNNEHAPNSHAYVDFGRRLNEAELAKLQHHGFVGD